MSIQQPAQPSHAITYEATKILAIDWGSRRIGLALADRLAKIAEPISPLINSDKLLTELKNLCQVNRVDQIVVGLPRNLDGEETAQSQEIRQFAEKVAQINGLPVAMQDESLTSAEVAGAIKSPKFGFDSEAAAVILKDYLESQK